MDIESLINARIAQKEAADVTSVKMKVKTHSTKTKAYVPLDSLSAIISPEKFEFSSPIKRVVAQDRQLHNAVFVDVYREASIMYDQIPRLTRFDCVLQSMCAHNLSTANVKNVVKLVDLMRRKPVNAVNIIEESF